MTEVLANAIGVHYLGLSLASPIVASASPMTAHYETARQLVCAGAGALVLPSLFQEQFERAESVAATGDVVVSRISGSDDRGPLEYRGVEPREYLNLIGNLRAQLSVPILASLNGTAPGPWLAIASDFQQAGASAVELNLQPDLWDPAIASMTIERRICDAVAEVRRHTTLPISVKLSPFVTSLPNLVQQLIAAGADGVHLFALQPHWDTNLEKLTTQVRWSLTTGGGISTTLAGLAMLRPSFPALSIAGGGGIATAEDLEKIIIGGADVAMVASILHREGPLAITRLLDGLRRFLQRHHYASVHQLALLRPAHSGRRSFLAKRHEFVEAAHCPLETSGETPSREKGDRWGHPEGVVSNPLGIS